MRKIAMLGIGAILLSVLPAEAQYYQNRNERNNRRYEHNRMAPRYVAPRYVAPAPRYYSPQRQWLPYAVGALGAVVAGTYFYNRYGETCQRIIVGQEWNGYNYAPVTEVVCD